MVFLFYIGLLIIVSIIGGLVEDGSYMEKIGQILCLVIIFDGLFVGSLRKLILDPLVKFAGS